MRWGMLSGLMNFLRACFRPGSDRYVHTGSDAGGRQDGLLWYKDSGQHSSGEFSMAVIQANNLLEDHSQIESGSLSSHESGPYGTFVGIYDGHGGPETARYINDHLFHHLKSKLLQLYCNLELQFFLAALAVYVYGKEFSYLPTGDWENWGKTKRTSIVFSWVLDFILLFSENENHTSTKPTRLPGYN